jgi:ferredoxin
MHVSVDPTKCQGHGECVLAAPELFDLDDTDVTARVLQAEPAESLRERAQLAERLCPMGAIAVS